jgi:pimeloyl-ACP methyl ester carboxylesterase
MTTREGTATLDDGRVLAFSEFGDLDGFPVVYNTGGNSSRAEGGWLAAAAAGTGTRLIVPDRPGFGDSTLDPHRTLAGWSADIGRLLDHLDIDHYSTLGLSGGGPHALALAHGLPERIVRVAVASGVAPPEMPDLRKGMWFPVRLIHWSGSSAPRLNRFLLRQMGSFYSDEDQVRRRMLQAMPAPDVELMERRPEIVSIFAEAAQAAHRNGIAGDAHEWTLYVNDWGFRLEEIEAEVGLWYGAYDRQAPARMGAHLEERLPNATLRVVDDGGHFSTINNHAEEIFQFLAP